MILQNWYAVDLTATYAFNSFGIWKFNKATNNFKLYYTNNSITINS